MACLVEGNLLLAKQHFAEAANLAFDLGNKMTISYSLDGFAALALEDGDLDRSAQLFGAAHALRESIGYKIEPAEEIFRNIYLERLRSSMDEPGFSSAFDRGRSLSPEAAIKFAFSASSLQ
jgi:hypothetical protein